MKKIIMLAILSGITFNVMAAGTAPKDVTVKTDASTTEKKEEKKATGMEIFNKQGNCIACHSINDDKNPQAKTAGNVGPPLDYLKGRNKKQIYDKVFDPTKTNPYTVMPAFGKKKVLTEEEVNLVVDYLFSVQK